MLTHAKALAGSQPSCRPALEGEPAPHPTCPRERPHLSMLMSMQLPSPPLSSPAPHFQGREGYKAG